MSARLRALGQSVNRSVQAHGGGWVGIRGVAKRAFQVLRALGLRGLLQAARAGSRPLASTALFSGAVEFPDPVPLSQVSLRIGVVAHVYYTDLIDEFVHDLSQIPAPFTLLVSVVDAAAANKVQEAFSRITNVVELKVRVVPNRGRDLAPVFVTFREEILSLDVFAHIHTKKSLYTGSAQDGWRRYLLDRLFGGRERVAWQLGMFQAMPKLGLLYPDSHPGVQLWAHTWLQNLPAARALAARLGIEIEHDRLLEFPAGSMFWARVDALRPLFELELDITDFPEESGQTDGTLQHALERMLGVVTQTRGFVPGVMPQDGRLEVHAGGDRNWQLMAATPFAERLALSSIDMNLVSFDLFDTVVLRPFLSPSGGRAFLGHLVRHAHGIQEFAKMRTLAEHRARARLGHDPPLKLIYEQLAQMPGHGAWPVETIRELELSTERSFLRKRDTVIEPLTKLQQRTPLAAISDMYLDQSDLREVLPESVSALTRDLFVSCETGQRKDEPSAWHAIAERMGVTPSRWLHVGDNELSDIQIPQKQGLWPPIQVLRPSTLLDAHPALRTLRPLRFDATPWQDQLWLGLLANCFALAFDTNPQQWRDQPRLDPETVGYAVLGPLAVDFSSWLARLAIKHGHGHVAFLSREGYLLQQVFERMWAHAPDSSMLTHSYLLASRRSTRMAAMRSPEDLGRVLDGSFRGTLGDLLSARLGDDACALVQQVLGRAAMQRDVFLPEQRVELVSQLRPAVRGLLDQALSERDAYLAYWRSQVGGHEVLVADVGYAGSIQAALSRIVERPVAGAYFALREAASATLDSARADARFFDERQPSLEDASSHSTILRHDLLLETLLTAPDGQLDRFRLVGGSALPEHRPHALDAAQLKLIDRVHRGCLTFVDDYLAVAGVHWLEAALNPHLVQQPLDCLGTDMWSAPELAVLAVDDFHTGRGFVRSQG